MEKTNSHRPIKMTGKTTIKTALQQARKLPDEAVLEEGNPWYVVATLWWEEFQVCSRAKDAPSVRNDPLVDKQISSRDRKVAVLNPKLVEGADFVFVSETSWEVIAGELGFDWEIRREVIYERSRQHIEPYPFAFKILYWTNDMTEPKELIDEAGGVVVVLGSRAHTLGQLLRKVWRAAPDDFRQKFPQFLCGIDPTWSTAASDSSQFRVCYHTRRSMDGEKVWVPIEKMLKRPRDALTSLRLIPRVKKRQARHKQSSNDPQSDYDGEANGVEYDEHSEGRGRLTETRNLKLGDLRLDSRSEFANGATRLHELLVEQKGQDAGDARWPSQGVELHWRMDLAKGDTLDALDTSRSWYEARLLDARRNKVYVHYRGWESKWDEWISCTSPRLAPPYSRVPRWRSTLCPHALVQVGIQVPQRRHTKWRNATVIAVAPSTKAEQGQEGDGDGVGLWVNVQVDSNDMWLPAHDDLLCQLNTHNESSALTSREYQLLAHDDSLVSETLVSDSPKVMREFTVAMTDGECDEAEAGGIKKEGSIDSIGSDGSSAQPSHRPWSTRTSVETTITSRFEKDLRTPAVRNLSASFRQVQDEGQSSAGRTPARGRGRTRSQVSSDHTSPEPVSPGSPSQGSHELQTLWTQVGRDLQSLHASWTQLGTKVFSYMDVTESGQQ